MAKYSKRDDKMFKKLANFFTKEQEEKQEEKQEEVNATAAITVYTESNGEFFVDIQVKDESEESINHLVKILGMYSPEAFVDINFMIKNSCSPELHTRIITHFVDEVGTDYFKTNIPESINNQPCISPSDML